MRGPVSSRCTSPWTLSTMSDNNRPLTRARPFLVTVAATEVSAETS